MPSPRIIALTGLKHVGKSSVCRYIAAHSNRLNADTDDEIVSAAKARLPRAPGLTATPRDVYLELGAATFATLETVAVETVINRAEREDVDIVLATGGGICDNADAFTLLRQRAEIVFLDAPPDSLYPRIAAGGVPAFLDPERPFDHFMELAALRRERYRTAARYRIDVSTLNVDEIGDAIIDHFR
ncbi:MAG: hypothetical protein PF508_12980 [Spirochaeta sp.]|jgi:shikimate kinase|nr:hypothetical protein [Spirochaeta sp.]